MPGSRFLFVMHAWQLCGLLFASSSRVLAHPRHHPRDLPVGTAGNRTFDYVIVGGGVAGLTLASRLSETSSVTVAVIEAGTFYEEATGNQSQVPAYDYNYNGKSASDTNSAVEWGFMTTEQAGIDDQSTHYTRGKTLGGCSALNYMAYEWAPKGAMDRWADEVGDDSWSYENVVPYYQKSINFTTPDMTKRIANSTPSYDTNSLTNQGPLHVGYANYAQAFSTWLAKGMEQVGILPQKGFEDGVLNGSSWLTSTLNHETGFRESSETAFLRPVMSERSNLVVYTETMGLKILFENTTAKGVLAETSSNTTFVLSAAKEVIVSGGVFQSPQLLLVSGVGPADLLEENGIEVVANRPGVGQNMQDHVFYGIANRVNVQTSSALQYGDTSEKAIEEFQTSQSGMLSSPGGDFGGYEKIPQSLRSNFSTTTESALATFPDDWPEMQYLGLPAYVGNFMSVSTGSPPDGYMYATLLATLIAPVSRGNVSISSASMKDQPLINPNWLTAEADIELAIAGFKRIREIVGAPVMKNIVIGSEYYPGGNVTTDAQIHQQIKDSFNTMYHAASTNKMGKDSDPMAVVDTHGRVYGTQNLRVVDISAFALLPPGVPQGTVYMVAEKIAEDIKNGN